MVLPANGLAAGCATARALVFGQVIFEPGVARKRPVADRAIDAGVSFVVVAEHGGS
jgi:hypothetical protein